MNHGRRGLNMHQPSDIEQPTFEHIVQARKHLEHIVQKTPLDFSSTLSKDSNNRIFLKLENLQKTGSFKLRGAYYRLFTLSEKEKEQGVIAASAGNHAQGVAYAASILHIPCTIVMPENASLAKVSATQRYGANVILQGIYYDDAYAYAQTLCQKEGLTYIHAFDDPLIIAGQGTIGLEILEQLPSVQAILVPMGGGGLATGIALAVKHLRPDIKVYGIEAANAACFRQSFDHGQLETLQTANTIADGIAVKRPGDLTYDLAKTYIDDVLTVEEEEISKSMVFLLERCKVVSEGAGAAAVAAAIHKKIPENLGDVVAILSGGNVDVTVLSRIIEHGLSESGRFLRLSVTIADRPGALRDLLDIFARLGANVLTIQHHRVGTKILFGQTEVEVDLETKDKKHIEKVLAALHQAGYKPVF